MRRSLLHYVSSHASCLYYARADESYRICCSHFKFSLRTVEVSKYSETMRKIFLFTNSVYSIRSSKIFNIRAFHTHYAFIYDGGMGQAPAKWRYSYVDILRQPSALMFFLLSLFVPCNRPINQSINQSISALVFTSIMQ